MTALSACIIKILYKVALKIVDYNETPGEVTSSGEVTEAKMFGLFTTKTDRENAQIIHMYLGTFYRTFDRMGMEFMLNTIKTNPLVTEFTDFTDYKVFFVKESITDFQFTIPTLKIEGAKPTVIAAGRRIYKGISAHITLDTGRMFLLPDSSLNGPPTTRAVRFAKEFEALIQH